LIQKFGCNRGIVTANFLNELTFVHVSYTFKIERLDGHTLVCFSDRLSGRSDLKSARRK
jgi:hypothetical protein